MSSTITAIAVIVGLTGWHVHNRRLPGWQASPEGRHNIYCGYFLVVIAVYWLVSAPTATAWEWMLGNAWALAAMVAFVSGFAMLKRTTTRDEALAQLMESLQPTQASTQES